MTMATTATEHALGRDATEDGRFYVMFAGTDREERFRSVTAATGRWDKDGLIPWGSGLAANEAFEILPQMVAALLEPECGRTYWQCKVDHDWRERCPDCRCRACQPCLVRYLRDRHDAESHRRMDEGSRVHAIVDHWVKTGIWLVPEDDIAVYIHSFKRFVADCGLTPEDWELAEARVINRTYMYAGTLDGVLNLHRGRTKLADDTLDRLTRDGQPRVQHARVLVDYKSREKPDRAVFMDMPLQLAGYRFAETIVLVDGTELPMLQVDAAAVIQIRPDKTGFELLLVEEPEFAVFLNLLGADDWALVRGKRAIGARTHSYAPSVVKMRDKDRREAKKREAALAKQDSAVVASPVATETTEAPAPAPDNSPAARGKRAAAAARRGPSPVLAEMAEANGRTVKPALGSTAAARAIGYGRTVVDVDLDQMEEPPF